jgi:hypothetical protein
VVQEKRGDLFDMPKGSDDESEPASGDEKPSPEKVPGAPLVDPMESVKNKS